MDNMLPGPRRYVHGVPDLLQTVRGNGHGPTRNTLAGCTDSTVRSSYSNSRVAWPLLL
jgi:hypothetical protein